MVLPVTETAPLPWPAGRGSDIGSLAGFNQDLVKALTNYLAQIAHRANQGLALDGTLTMIGGVRLANVTYTAALQLITDGKVQNGMIIYITNGRKVGEGAGTGTGIVAYYSGAAWYSMATDTAVTV